MRDRIPGAIHAVQPRRGYVTVAAIPRTVAEVDGLLGVVQARVASS